MSTPAISEGFNPIFDWLAKQQAETAHMEEEKRQLQQENDELRAQILALTAGKGVSVVINGTPFYLTPNAPSMPAIAMHVVPDLSATTVTGLENSFLLARDTDEHQAIFAEKTA